MNVTGSVSFFGLPGPDLRNALWDRYRSLVAQGHPSDRILVLIDGSSRARWDHWQQGLTADAGRVTGGLWLLTPFAWMQQELRLWWGPVLDELEKLGLPVTRSFEPVFAAIDLAQYLLTHFTAHRRVDGGLLSDAHSSPDMQNVQILDAISRAIENGVSLRSQATFSPVHDRSGEAVSDAARALAGAISSRLAVGGIALAQEVGEAIALYVDGMLRAGILDHGLQLELFCGILWPLPDFCKHIQSRFSHVLVENLDELPPRIHDLLRNWPGVGIEQYYTLQRDPEGTLFSGGLREHLGADPRGAWELAESTTRLEQVPLSRAPFAPLGRGLLRELTGDRTRPPQPVQTPPGAVHVHLGAYSPAEMLQDVSERLMKLLSTGSVLPRHVALVSPTLSPLLIWSLRHKLAERGIPLYVFAGTNRLRDYRPVRILLTLARLAFPAWELPPTRYDLLELLELCTGLNPIKLGRVAPQLIVEGALADKAFLKMAVPDISDRALARYGAIRDWIGMPRKSDALPAFLRGAFTQIYALARTPRGVDATADEAFMREISQIGQLIELSERFESVDDRLRYDDQRAWALRFLAFLDNSPIAERPFFQREPHQDAVVLSTPSQLAERGFTGVDDEIKALFLLDLGSEGWRKRDRRELSNARVLSRHWPNKSYDSDTEALDMNDKLGRVLLACLLKVQERLFLYGCLTDEDGRENNGELPYLFNSLLGGNSA